MTEKQAGSHENGPGLFFGTKEEEEKMTYQQAVARVDSRLRFGIKAGLDNITALLHKLGDPHKKLRVVHVAGTNGKGTTCTLLAAVLCKAGYRTGLFTSPYVIDFRERFIINGTMIEPEGVIQLVKKVEPAVLELEQEGVYVTEFEMITAMGFLWFYEQQCDIVVLEVGPWWPVRCDQCNRVPRSGGGRFHFP